MAKRFRYSKDGLTKAQRDYRDAQPIVRDFEQYAGDQAISWATEVAKDIEFVNNVQWDSSVAVAMDNDNQPVTTNNEMKPARDQVVNQLTENDPRWLATPREDSDASLAGKVSDFASYIWDESTADMHFRTAVEDFEDTGRFVLHGYYDPDSDMGKGDIKIVRVNPQEIIIDPLSTWRNAQDSRKIYLATVIQDVEVQDRYPDFDFEGAVEYQFDMKQYGTGAIREGQIFRPDFIFTINKKYYRVIDEYSRIKINMFWVYDPNSNFEKVLDKKQYIQFAQQPAIIMVRKSGEKAITQEQDIRKYMSIIETYGNVFHQYTDGSIEAGVEDNKPKISPQGQLIQPIPGSTTQLRIVTMTDLLNEGKIRYQIVRVPRILRKLVVGEKLYRQMVMPISDYPFGITMLHHTGNPFCYGDARLTRPIQEQINKISSIIIAYNINLASIRAFIQKNSMDIQDMKERYGKIGIQLFEYDSEIGEPPIIQQMTQMSNAFYLQLDRLRDLLQRIYGAYPAQEGQVQSAPDTVGGTLLLDEAGLRRSAAKLKLIEGALNDLGSVIGEMIPYVYTERKLIRILQPNGETKDIAFNDQQEDGDIIRIINDLTANRYDIKMLSGSTLPSNRAARFNALLKLWELKALRNPAPLLRETDLPNIDEIIKNEDMLNQTQNAIMQLQQNVKMLQGALQTKTKEKVHADEKALLAKTKASLDALVARANAAVLTGQKRIDDIVKQLKKIESRSESEMPTYQEQTNA